MRPDGRVAVELPDLRQGEPRKRGRYAKPRSTLPLEQWSEVREQAARCGLRATARVFGVSHEAVRQIVLRG